MIIHYFLWHHSLPRYYNWGKMHFTSEIKSTFCYSAFNLLLVDKLCFFASIIIFHENCIDVWSDLKERFYKDDKVCICLLRALINNLKQSSNYRLFHLVERFTGRTQSTSSFTYMYSCSPTHVSFHAKC